MAMHTSESIQNWLVDYIAEEMAMDTSEIGVQDNLAELGIDSITMVEVTAELSKQLNQHIDPTLLYEYTTIKEIADFLAKK